MSGNRKQKHEAVLAHLAAATKVQATGMPGPAGMSGVPPIAMAAGIRQTQLEMAQSTISELRQELERVKAEGGEVRLDPARIRHGRFRDRHELGFSDSAFEELKRSIQQRGENVQAILVRPLPPGDEADYEVVLGAPPASCVHGPWSPGQSGGSAARRSRGRLGDGRREREQGRPELL